MSDPGSPGRPDAVPSAQTRRARYAVSALFFANGALFANVVPRFPDLKASLELSNAAFGTAIAAYGLGALVIGLLAGALVSRWGSARVAPLSTLGISANLVLLGIAPSWATLAGVLLAAGALDAIADVAGNAHGLRVERVYGQSILNAQHGVWSVGAVVGGAMGAVAAGLAIPIAWHLATAAALFAALAAGVSRFLLPGPDDAERVAPEGAGTTLVSVRRLGRVPIARSILTLGAIAAMAQIMEDATAAWGAVYLREDLGAAAAVSGLGFIALQATQTVGRLFGDRMVTRFGDRAVARAGAALAGLAMAGALMVPTIATTILAFGVVGIGIGTLIPASLRTADGIPGLRRGVGLTLVGSVDRVALLAVPPIIGVVADEAGLRLGLLSMPIAAVVVLLLSRALPQTPVRHFG